MVSRLSKAVRGASLVKLEGSGHELNQADWEKIIEAIAAHTRSSDRAA
jgi:hypothetical protein